MSRPRRAGRSKCNACETPQASRYDTDSHEPGSTNYFVEKLWAASSAIQRSCRREGGRQVSIYQGVHLAA
jgi:hypothetical protein